MRKEGECRWIRCEELVMHGVGSVTRSLYLRHSVRMWYLVSRFVSPQGHATGSLEKNLALYSPMGT